MIIKRQKLYTRNDVKVLKELHQATNGYRRLPDFSGMTRQDLFRFRNITRGFRKHWTGKGNQEINPEDLKILATHLGLPETAKSGMTVLNKYTNPELLERFTRIRKIKLQKEIETQKKEVEALRKKWLEGGTLNDCAKLQRASKKLAQLEEGIDLKTQENIEKFIDRQRRGRLSANKKLDELIQKYENPELAQQELDRARVEGITIKGPDPEIPYTSSMRPRQKELYLHPKHKNSPAVIRHELSHEEEFRKEVENHKKEPLYAYRYSGDYTEGLGYENPLFDLGEEAIASGRALSRTAAGIGTAKDIAEAKEIYTSGLQSYFHGAVKRLPEEFAEKIKPKM